MQRRLLSLFVLSFVLVSACGDDDVLPLLDAAAREDVADVGAVDAGIEVDATPPGVTEVYDPERVLEISVELPPESWDALRNQSRSLVATLSGDCLAGPFDQPFSWFEGSVTIDGEEFERVDVRKKGFIGSLSTARPGFKLDLGEYVDG